MYSALINAIAYIFTLFILIMMTNGVADKIDSVSYKLDSISDKLGATCTIVWDDPFTGDDDDAIDQRKKQKSSKRKYKA